MQVFRRYNLIDQGNLHDAMGRLNTYLSNSCVDTSRDPNIWEPPNSWAAKWCESRG
jgi:hypothetical protein